MSPIKTYGFTHLAIAVRDVERTLSFYQQIFGVEVMYKKKSFLQVKTPGCNDIIVFEEHPELAGKSGGIMHFGFMLRTPEEITHVLEVLKDACAEIIDQGEFVPGEPYVFFRDPDGYEVEVAYEKLNQ
ncbi:MAG TPA: VOC family protein [Chitinophagaceae bacterium]|jgi:catechol 2,3-dioxygenase-like lactoylglutathione lyase family enzyme